MITDLILGTAGHIDHGKTSLVRALTGTDTDRLPEEKQRGITIELGFAELQLDAYRLGIVDVPGHERFVRQMLAGATGMDLVLLVVAADDSVKPQTREHLEVLRLLDLPAGVIALTKVDMADPEWVELVEAEVRELVAGTFLENAAIVRTSATTGEGIEELRMVLSAAAETAMAVRPRSLDGPFRMAIDRAFTIAGHGTVVTGSVLRGRARVGDQLVIEPGNIEVRVRGLQNHDRVVDNIQRGQRAAINLAGVRHDELHRGHELASPEHLVPSRLMTARISLLDTAPRPLKNRDRVRLHIGTAEILCTVRLLQAERLEPGSEGWAQLFLREPAVSVWHQPLVLRSESPVRTIGGGRVMVPDAEPLRKPGPEVFEQLAALSSPDPWRRSSAALYFSRVGSWEARDLARTAGVNDVSQAETELRQRGDLINVEVSPHRTVRLHRLVSQHWLDRIERALEVMHARNPLIVWLDRSKLMNRFAYVGDALLLEALLQQMQQHNRIRRSDKRIALVSHGPKLSKNEQALFDTLVERYREAQYQPPTVKECVQIDKKREREIKQLIDMAVAQDELVHVEGDLFLHRESEEKMRDLLAERLAGSEGMTISEIREVLATTRKYAVPICQYLDRIGFTRRVGDLRILGNPPASRK
jgi:selenocysteine-specific elongation factor